MYMDPARDTVEDYRDFCTARDAPIPSGVVNRISKLLDTWQWIYFLTLGAFICAIVLRDHLFGGVSLKKKSPSQARPSSQGLKAGLEHGVCGSNEVHLSRVPHNFKIPLKWRLYSRPNWLTLLGVVHSRPVSLTAEIQPPSAWPEDLVNFETSQSQTVGDPKSCIPISRATLMTLFALTNARPIFSYSSASGYRSAYPSYCGQWSITWPIGRPCFVSLAGHDSHAAATDVYPLSFPARVDKCVEMLAGIVTDGKGWKLAFPGRAKSRGPWALRERKKGLAGAHGQRHLWNMVGGKVWEVDLLVLEPRENDKAEQRMGLELATKDRTLGALFVAEHEQSLLAKALDYLPWTSLSWSMHWGMRDILLAYGKPIMDRYRTQVATMVKEGVKSVESALVGKGWNPDLVKESMGDLAESTILSGSGNSGDMVRVVVAIVECLVEDSDVKIPLHLDTTTFWSEMRKVEDPRLEIDTLIALTKFLVLEWSQELDYQLYHELPVELYLV